MSGREQPSFDTGAVRAVVSEALDRDGARWLSAQRWFADKGRPVASIALVDLLAAPVADALLVLAIAEVAFSGGDSARYFLPLALPASNAAGGAAPAPGPGDNQLVDATDAPWFGGWLLEALSSQSRSDAGQWAFTTIEGAEPILSRAADWPGFVMRAEQSNTSIRFGETLIVKLVRRLQPAPNPEEEALRVLAAGHFAATPAYAGSASWRDENGVRYPILLAQAFVLNLGDGWSWTLSRLENEDKTGTGFGEFAPERLLGERTADLHVVFSNARAPGFHPVQADLASAERAVDATRASIERAIALLHDQQNMLPMTIRARLPEIESGLRGLAEATEGFRAEVGLPRIRVHGDYHLGQTLRTTDDDWMIIDFEGEPARPVSERRQPTSPLKDVAGMLRSFAYARGAFAREFGDAATAARWERGARTAFLAGYRQRLREDGARLVPEDEDEFHQALRAWEIDKALYEIAYEARNRPDWLGLPLRALLPGLSG